MRALAALVLVVLVVLALPAGAARAAEPIGDANRGEAYWAFCGGCHDIGDGARNRVGPHLNGIFGRRAAGLEGFRYSRAMERAGADGLTWTRETLDLYIDTPKRLVSGTRMSFRGLKDARDRADLIAYLRVHSDRPGDIPEAEPTARAADHGLDPAILALEGDAAYGAYLSGECVTCHRAAGDEDGIPAIAGWPREDLVIALQAYKLGQRPHPVMRMIARRLSDEEIASLAAHFAALD